MGMSASGKNTNSISPILLPTNLLQKKSRDQLMDLAAVMNLQMVNMSESSNFIQNDREGLKRENSRFRKILDIIENGLVIHQGGIILESNRTFNRMFDYRKKELIGRSINTMIDRISLKKITNNIVMDTTRTHEGTAVRKDGNTFPCEIRSRVIESRGSIVHLTIFKDITAKKEAEQEKEALREKLSQSEKLEAVGHLASCVAHDLNNILGAIVGYPDLILMENSVNDCTREMVEKIKESGMKAAALVQDLLTMARRGVISTEIVNINTIIRNFFMSPEFDKLKQLHSKVRFQMELDESLMNILGSPFHINKALMNLITNAAEAMPKGGEITVQTSNLQFDRMVKGYGLNDYAVVKIIDEGVGIPEDEVDRIFEPFYTKKDMGKSGTGLGMSVVWGAVRDHKGYINMDSEVGEGTTF